MVRTSKRLTVGEYCKQYRTQHNTPLLEIAGETPIQTLYSFESGKSTNYNHIRNYLNLAHLKGEGEIFMLGLVKTLIKKV